MEDVRADVVAPARRKDIVIRWLPVIGLMVTAILAGVLFARLTPPGYGPDEPSHWHYVQLVVHGSLPGAEVPERQQPPLAYAFGALIVLAGGDLLAVRLLSAALSAATVLFAALAARELWPASPGRWFVVAAVPALLPETQWLSGTVSNDSLSFACGAALTLLAVMTFTRRPSGRILVLMGVAVAAALLAKETTYSLVAILVVCVILRWRGVLISRYGAAAAAIPLLMSGWWFARNAVAFHSPLPPLEPLLTPGTARVRLTTRLARQWLDTTAQNLVGNFITLDTVDTAGAAAWRSVLHVLDLAVAAAACVLVVVGSLSSARSWDGNRRGLGWMLSASVVVPFAVTAANSVFIDYQPQGRYLLVGVPAAAILAVGGAMRLPVIVRRAIAAVAVGVVLALEVVAFVTLHLLTAGVA